MSDEAGSAPVWQHRVTNIEEHEIALRAMREGNYPSMSLFVREAVLRLAYADNPGPLFVNLADAGERVRNVAHQLEELREEVMYGRAAAGREAAIGPDE